MLASDPDDAVYIGENFFASAVMMTQDYRAVTDLMHFHVGPQLNTKFVEAFERRDAIDHRQVAQHFEVTRHPRHTGGAPGREYRFRGRPVLAVLVHYNEMAVRGDSRRQIA